jgi:type I restriction enzyme, S subunit
MASRRFQSQTRGRPATTGVIAGDFALSVGRPEKAAPLGWHWTALSDVARLETGHTPSRRHPEYWGGDVPWIGIKDATENHGRVIFETFQHTNKLGIENSSARILPKNTVCLSRTASVGYVVVMGRPMATSQDFVNWVCSDALDHQFLKYVLLAERAAFLRFASGTTHQTIYFPEVKAFHICLPPLEEQQAIAHILGTLDDKIELNRRMSETLEAMARTLFKSWFIDFDPVRAKAEGRDLGLPKHLADLFPARLVESELGEIPEGWEVKSLDEIAHFLNGLALQKYPPVEGRYLPVIKIAQLRAGNTSGADRASAELKAEYIVQDGDVLFSWSGSLECVLWSGGQGALNQHLFKVTSADYPPWLCYLGIHAHLENFRHIAAGKATTMGHIQRHHLSEALLALPPRPILMLIDTHLSPLIESLWRRQSESRTLATIRDSLLSRLVSGEMRVQDADQLIDEVLL